MHTLYLYFIGETKNVNGSIFFKNMVCNRSIAAVKEILNDAKADYQSVSHFYTGNYGRKYYWCFTNSVC
jgi:hypothetical protein